MEKKIAIVIHGGAGPDSEFILQNKANHEEGLAKAVEAGYKMLEKGGSAVDAVEAAVISLENNPLFNAGRGSALNAAGKVEMCASMMDGKHLQTGAAAIITNVKNPICFVRKLMEDEGSLYLGAEEARETAKDFGMEMETAAYFVTEHQFDVFAKEREKAPAEASLAFKKYHARAHGTVGAVAVDKHGNVAAGTSTGGTEFCQPGRIGDSSMIGVGTYANNKTAAISCTGDGEYLIRDVMAHSISAAIEHSGCSVQEAANLAIHVKNGHTKADLGTIVVDAEGNIGMAFNSERMHRAWRSSDGESGVMIYK